MTEETKRPQVAGAEDRPRFRWTVRVAIALALISALVPLWSWMGALMLWMANVLVAALLCLIAIAFAVRRIVKGRADSIPIGRLALAAVALVTAPWITIGLGREAHIRTGNEARAAAEALVPRLDAYRQSHGRYPADLSDLGEGASLSEGMQYSPYRDGACFRFVYSVDPIEFLPDFWDSEMRWWDSTD